MICAAFWDHRKFTGLNSIFLSVRCYSSRPLDNPVRAGIWLPRDTQVSSVQLTPCLPQHSGPIPTTTVQSSKSPQGPWKPPIKVPRFSLPPSLTSAHFPETTRLSKAGKLYREPRDKHPTSEDRGLIGQPWDFQGCQGSALSPLASELLMHGSEVTTQASVSAEGSSSSTRIF